MKNDSMIILEKHSSKLNTNSGRFKTSNSWILQSPPQQYKKMVDSLQKIVKQQKQKRQQIEEKFDKLQQRSIDKEKQFHRILALLDVNIAKHSNKNLEIDKLYSQILLKFDQSQLKINEVLQVRYKQNLGMMQRKISEVLRKMEAQLNKNYKLTQAQHATLRFEMNRLETLASEIEKSNLELATKNASLQFRIKVLSEQKKMLIEEVNEKKKLAKKYYQETRLQKSFVQRPKSECGSQSNSLRFRKNSLSRDKPSTTDQKTRKETQNYTQILQNKLSHQITSNKKGTFYGSSRMHPKKEYISTMTFTIDQPRGQKSTFLNSSRQQQAGFNAISSLKQVLSRQRRKKVQYQNSLAQVQQKIISIDRIVVETMIRVKEMNQIAEKNFEQSFEFQWIREVLDKVKNIINGNEKASPNTQEIQKKSNEVNELLKLLTE